MSTRRASSSKSKSTVSTKKPAEKPAEKAASKPATVTGDVPARVQAAGMKKKELIEKVVKVSGAKKKDAKPVVEAMIAVLGEAIAEGRELNLQPLGKLKINRAKETPNARIVVAKIRQRKSEATTGDSAKTGVADAAE